MNKIQKINIIIASSVAFVTFIVFLPSLQNEFVNWDDNYYVYENTHIRSFDIELLKYAFAGFHESNWHPLTWLSHAVDYAIWSLNPLGHHLTNNILHALNTLIVVFLVMRLMEILKETAKVDNCEAQSFLNDHTMRITGAATGLLFGLHPLHVESVAWVAERKDVLCAFFFLLTIITYTHYVSETKQSTSTNSASRFFSKKYLLAIGFFILSLLSKPMAVTLPFVLLILDWYPFGVIHSFKTFRMAFIEKIPFFVLTLISSILTIFAQEAGGAIKSVEDIPLALRVGVAVKSLIAYLIKMMLPLNLVPFYPYPENISFFSLEFIIPIVIVMVITTTCIAVMKKQKLWMSVWSYYVITLTPVLGIVQVGRQSMADRYAYLPSLGPFLIVGIMMAWILTKVKVRERWRSVTRVLSAVIIIGSICFMSYLTIEQIGLWKNSDALWTYVIEKEPTNVPIAYKNRAVYFISTFQLEKAMADCDKFIFLQPYDDGHIWRKIIIMGFYERGNFSLNKGNKELAIQDFRIACGFGYQGGCDALRASGLEMQQPK
jgi:protein O-mannosyl-transferase